MKTIGIIGFGSFGKFLAEKLSSYAKVSVYSSSGKASSWAASIEEVAACDYVIPAIPLESYETVLVKLRQHIAPQTVVVDVCSVKVKPVQAITRILPGKMVVATHPMFGPESASVSLKGHTMVMCPDVSSPEPYATIKKFVESLGLDVKEMTLEEHDREIAVVQGLTFFVARTLETMGIHDQKLHTPSFGRLLNLAELETHHSQELFETIQLGNVYSSEVRKRFIATAERIDTSLGHTGSS